MKLGHMRRPLGPLQPFDLEYGDDLRLAEVRAAVLEVVDKEEPDLVILEPPCGPWSTLQNLAAEPEELARKREADRPFWVLARDVWERQDAGGRLVLTEQPFSSAALKLSESKSKTCSKKSGA